MEIGIRLAIGAPRPSIAKLLLQQATKPVLIGILAGTLMAIAAAPSLDAVLFQSSARDPKLLALTATVVLLAALLAAFLPTLSASRMNLATALRAD